ncbi:DUF4235 domain-containing protein [Luteimicrobium subarcticum]|uniref:Uncharacterized protein DUF4235 n=1 Tax=Luteimicrobium subarcticum TaxID=620910 RepID=A0A2M8W6Y5_9MICO|nr:DUF4235 domain-containing protein [Luteimicrobium subarcticum]PJI86691.1 uncharacterized protein DUF4235 [Luteimicrobium subarcticum]
MAEKPDITTQVLTTVLSAAAGWAAQKIVRSVWSRSGMKAPRNATDTEVTAAAAILFAALAAAVGAAAQRAATQGAGVAARRLKRGH